MQPRYKAMWTAALLSPIFGELLTGSTSPLVFVGPLFVLYLGLYGTGVLLIHEFLVRFNKGPASLLVLGLAYGVYEEALVVHSWFDPQFTNARMLGEYGRVGQLNVVWAVWVSPWLALISIAAPLFIADLLYPEQRGQPYLTKYETGLWAAGGAFVFIIANASFSNLASAAAEFAVATAVVVGLVAAAFFLPRHWLTPRPSETTRAGGPFLVLGAIWAAFEFTIAGIGAAAGLHPAIAVVIIAAGWAVGFLVLERLLGDAQWRKLFFMFFVGVLAFFALRDIFSAGGPATVGVRAVGAVFLYWAYRLNRRLWPVQAPTENGEPAEPAADTAVEEPSDTPIEGNKEQMK